MIKLGELNGGIVYLLLIVGALQVIGATFLPVQTNRSSKPVTELKPAVRPAARRKLLPLNVKLFK